MRGRYAIPNARRRIVNNAVTRPVETKGEIDILEVGAELFGEHSHLKQRIPPIERAGSAGAEHVAALQINRGERLSVTAFAGHAAGEVTIPGAIDPPRSLIGRTA